MSTKKLKPMQKNEFKNQMKMTKKHLETSLRPMMLLRIRRKKMDSETSATSTKPNRKNKSISKQLKTNIVIRLTKRPKKRCKPKKLQQIKKRKPRRLKTKKMNLVTSVSSMTLKKSSPQQPKMKKMKKMTILEISMTSRLVYKKLRLPV